jgi:aerobic carbon-monoxide dehydrogenase medium subunit
MKTFVYHRPTALADAVKLTAQPGADIRVLAGGQSLLPAMKLRLSQPTDVIDLAGLADLNGIRVEGTTLKIGAMTTHATVGASADVQRVFPALAELAGNIGDRQVRNRGTIGGSLANDDPAACYPAAVLGSGATVHTDRRSIQADAFFLGLFETALEPGELITSVDFPVQQRAAYVRQRQKASHFALVAVFVGTGADGGVRVAVTGAGQSGVFRVREFEDALTKRFEPGALDGLGVDADALMTDIHASAEYRAHLIQVLAKRAVAQAIERGNR